MPEQQRKVYLECTHTLESNLNTGIQRVVRNVLETAQELEDQLQISVQPVVIEDGEFYPVKQRSRLKRRLHRTVARIQRKASGDFSSKPIRRRLIKLLFPRSIVRWAVKRLGRQPQDRIDFGSGDILLMLDSSWHLPAWQAIRHAQQKGCVTGCVYYDLIPLQYPQYCSQPLVPLYCDWLNQAVEQLDFFISISKTVANDLRDHAQSRQSAPAKNAHFFESFNLGADFSGTDAPSEPPRNELVAVCESAPGNLPWLTVGTVEPRKNHAFLLDAFEQVWQTAPDAKLLIVGKVGWNCEDLIHRIQSHQQYGKSLFHFDNLNDAELQYCYQNTRALIFPSIVEGYGLPIIEALQSQLPVFASSTTIHHEVGGSYCHYFPLNDCSELAGQIVAYQAGALAPAQQAPRDFRANTWESSTRELLTKSIALADEASRSTETSRAA